MMSIPYTLRVSFGVQLCSVPASRYHGNHVRKSPRMVELMLKVEEAERTVERTRQWYGVRFARLKQWADTLPQTERHAFYSILANAAVGLHEPPTYDQQMNILRYQRDEARRRLAECLEKA